MGTLNFITVERLWYVSTTFYTIYFPRVAAFLISWFRLFIWIPYIFYVVFWKPFTTFSIKLSKLFFNSFETRISHFKSFFSGHIMSTSKFICPVYVCDCFVSVYNKKWCMFPNPFNYSKSICSSFNFHCLIRNFIMLKKWVCIPLTHLTNFYPCCITNTREDQTD